MVPLFVPTSPAVAPLGVNSVSEVEVVVPLVPAAVVLVGLPVDIPIYPPPPPPPGPSASSFVIN